MRRRKHGYGMAGECMTESVTEQSREHSNEKSRSKYS